MIRNIDHKYLINIQLYMGLTLVKLASLSLDSSQFISTDRPEKSSSSTRFIVFLNYKSTVTSKMTPPNFAMREN